MHEDSEKTITYSTIKASITGADIDFIFDDFLENFELPLLEKRLADSDLLNKIIGLKQVKKISQRSWSLIKNLQTLQQLETQRLFIIDELRKCSDLKRDTEAAWLEYKYESIPDTEKFDFTRMTFSMFKTHIDEINQYIKIFKQNLIYVNSKIALLKGYCLSNTPINANLVTNEISLIKEGSNNRALQLTNSETETTNNEISSPLKQISGRIFGLFCSMINDSGVLIRGEENKTDFCKKVAEKYGYQIPERTRNYFKENVGFSVTGRVYKQVENKIFACIDRATVSKIKNYLSSQNRTYH